VALVLFVARWLAGLALALDVPFAAVAVLFEDRLGDFFEGRLGDFFEALLGLMKSASQVSADRAVRTSLDGEL
jgi:hypothetical protein